MSGNSAIVIIGPAGAGKTTFCHALVQHGVAIRRPMHVLNLDPAAENLPVTPFKDIRELITVDEAMEEMGLGPNGALLFCMDYLMDNLEDWLGSDLEEYQDEFLIIDCPGQIELYTHCTYMKRILNLFQQKGYNVCCLYLLESAFLHDATKYFAGVLNAMAAMIQLEVPHINIMTKIDLLDTKRLPEDLLDRYFQVDPLLMADWIHKETKPAFYNLNQAIVQLIEEYGMVSFVPSNIQDEDSMVKIMIHIDNAVQYGESQEPKEPQSDIEVDSDDE
jgi:GTPase SAR1 family protein